jgi:cell division protein WhiA
MAGPPSFTERVRQELSRAPLGTGDLVRAELAALVRFGGRLAVAGGDPPQLRLEVETTSGAVARRVFTGLQHRYGIRPELAVRAPGGVHRRSTYGVRVRAGARRIGADLWVVDAAGRPTDGLPPDLTGDRAIAFLRGALLAAGSISSPGRPPHLEITASSRSAASALATLTARLLGARATAVAGDPPRMVIKSGEAIGELLAAVGAPQAFLAWDDRRLRRQLRNEANRLANADGANLRRTIDAAAHQVEAVERAVAAVGWDALDEELRSVALARLANPEASLAELGELVDPPVGKSAVHRRLRRLEALAATSPATDEQP